jgi:CRISPR-associated protein Csb2
MIMNQMDGMTAFPWAVQARPTAARYALGGSVLPPLAETVWLAELARRAALSKYGGPARRKSAILSGRDEAGGRLQGHHHAHYLPTDEDGDGRLDHLTVFAPARFDEEHRHALGALRVLNAGDGRPELGVVLLGFGEPAQYDSPILGAGAVWQSMTPFMLVRHPKPNGKDSPKEQLALEIRRRGLPEPISVSPLVACRAGGRDVRWLAFRRCRPRGPDPPVGQGFGFRVEFPHPVVGPLVLGYGAHFGLGQFVRER